MAETLLIKGRWVLTGDTVLENAAVAVEGDTIIETGVEDALRRKYANARVIGSDESAVLPGFVNAHHHSHGVSTIQHGLSDLLLEPWILSFAGLRRGDTYLETLLSAANQLRSGVTTVVDVHSRSGTSQQYTQSIDDALRAYEQAGIRVAFATGTATQSHLVHGRGQDQAFIDQLPEDLRESAKALLPGPDRVTGAQFLDIVSDRVRHFRGHERIDVWFAPPGPQWVSDELMQQIAERAASLDTGIQTHCNESLYEKLHGDRFYGQPTVTHLEQLGVLSPRFSLAHGVWLNERELDALARTGAGVSHNPSSNLRLRAGIAPLNALLATGIPVALGMDGTTINEDEDFFNEMRLALRLNRPPQLGVAAPTVEQVFRMATQGGARLMRKDAEIGRLATGYKADMIVVDLKRIVYPWVAPEVDPLELVVLRARRDDIDMVIVNGSVVMRRGMATGFHEAAAAESLAERLSALPYPAADAKHVNALMPHLEAWYRRWDLPELTPFTRYNAR